MVRKRMQTALCTWPYLSQLDIGSAKHATSMIWIQDRLTMYRNTRFQSAGDSHWLAGARDHVNCVARWSEITDMTAASVSHPMHNKRISKTLWPRWKDSYWWARYRTSITDDAREHNRVAHFDVVENEDNAWIPCQDARSLQRSASFVRNSILWSSVQRRLWEMSYMQFRWCSKELEKRPNRSLDNRVTRLERVARFRLTNSLKMER